MCEATTRPTYEMEHLVGTVRAALAEQPIPLELLAGSEIVLDMLPQLSDAVLRRFGLGGNPRYLLLEPRDSGWPLGLEQTVFELQLRGISVVLGHPERNDTVQEMPERFERLVEMGALIQLTAASVDRRLGPGAQKTSLRLLELELAHLLASDAHAPTVRQVGMSAASRTIGDEALARWLTDEVPAAIVAGGELPTRPERPCRHFRLGRRRT